MAQHADVLGTPDPPRRRSATGTASATSRRTRALVGLALVTLVLGGAADRRLADRERAALLEAVEAGEGTLSAARDSQLSLAQYAGPRLTSVVPPTARRSAFAMLARDAGRWEPRVRARQREVAALEVLPWHDELHAAKDAYAARLDVWADVLAEIEREPDVLTELLDGRVRDSRRRAADALVAAGLDPADVRSALAGGAAGGEADKRLRR